MRSQRSSRTAAASWRNCYLKVKRERKVPKDRIREREVPEVLSLKKLKERERKREGKERESCRNSYVGVGRYTVRKMS